MHSMTGAELTVDVYNQLLDRGKSQHGAAFDRLISDAQATLTGRKTAILAHYWPTERFAHRWTFPPSFEFWLGCRRNGGWTRRVSNLRPLACEASALPLSYASWKAESSGPVRVG
jgi:hypothetical protein